MDLDNLREQWKSLNIKVEDLQVENMRLRHDIQTNKVTSINRRLIARIRNMLLVCCLAPIFIIYMKNEIALTTATIVCYVSYFIIIGAAHGYLLWRLPRLSFNAYCGCNKGGRHTGIIPQTHAHVVVYHGSTRDIHVNDGYL